MVLVICSAYVFCVDRKKFKECKLFVVFIVVMCNAAIYGYQYITRYNGATGIGGSVTDAFKAPFKAVQFFCVGIGASLFQNHDYGYDFLFIIGLIILAFTLILLLYLISQKKVLENLFGVMLALYGMLVLAIITIGRITWGNAAACASRYTSFVIFITVGLYFIVCNLLGSASAIGIKNLYTSLMTVLVLSVPLSYVNGYIEADKHREKNLERQYLLCTYDTQPDAYLKDLYPEASSLRINADFMKERGYSAFKTALDAVPDFSQLERRNELANYGIDKSSIRFADNQSDPYVEFATPWAIDAVGKGSPSAVFVKAGNDIYRANLSQRKDVAGYFHDDAYLYSGFKRAIRYTDLEMGDNPISLLIVGGDGKYYYETPIVFSLTRTEDAVYFTDE